MSAKANVNIFSREKKKCLGFMQESPANGIYMYL